MKLNNVENKSRNRRMPVVLHVGARQTLRVVEANGAFPRHAQMIPLNKSQPTTAVHQGVL